MSLLRELTSTSVYKYISNVYFMPYWRPNEKILYSVKVHLDHITLRFQYRHSQ